MRSLIAATLAAAILFAPACSRADTPEEQLAAASALYDAHKFSDAALKLDAFLASNPRHVKAGAAAFVLGRCRSELKEYPLAMDAYDKAIASRDPDVQNLAELGLGEAAVNAKQFSRAVTALQVATKARLKQDQSAYAWLWLGQSEFQVKDFNASKEAYDHVVRDYGQFEHVDSAYLGFALAAVKVNQNDSARDHLRTLIDRYQRSDARPQALLLIAQIDLDAKRYGDARNEFERTLNDQAANAIAPIHSAAEDGLIQTLLAQQDYNSAAEHLEVVMNGLAETDPLRGQAALQLGDCRYRSKQFDKAVAAYRTAAESTDASVAARGLYWGANAAIQLRRPLEAALLFTKLVTTYPKDELAARSALKAGDAYADAGRTQESMHSYRLVVSRYSQSPEAAIAAKSLGSVVDSVTDPAALAEALKTTPPADRPKTTLRLARLYEDAKRYTEATTTLIDLLKTKPDEDIAAEARYHLGFCYDTQSKNAPALTNYALAVGLKPAASWSSDAQERLAWLYLDAKQPALAERAATAAIALHPTPAVEEQARLALIQSYLDQQKWDAALDRCKTLIASNPSRDTLIAVLYTEAWATEKRSGPEAALPFWDRIRNEFSNSQYAAEALIHLGDSLTKAQKYDDAEDRYNHVLNDFPMSPFVAEARYKLGTAYFNQNRLPEATIAFDAVAEDHNAGDLIPEALYWSGVALQKSGKNADAIPRLEKLVAQFPKNGHVANAKVRLAGLKAVSSN